MANEMIRVELMGLYGGDEAHALSAWTSTSRNFDAVDPKTQLTKRERMPQMLKQLAEAGHHTPFEKSALHFLVRCDKATHIQLIKHRIGVSVNAESARYKELKEDGWYLPPDWPVDIVKSVNEMMEVHVEAYHHILIRLEEAGLSRKRAKETARFLLPHASMVTQDVQFNFRSFMHFVGLRVDQHAQDEIHVIGLSMMYALIRSGGFQHSLDGFGWTTERFEEDAQGMAKRWGYKNWPELMLAVSGSL